MGTRLVLPDGEWIASDLPLEEVARRMADGLIIDGDRRGKRLVVNPAHIVYAEEWERPPGSDDDGG